MTANGTRILQSVLNYINLAEKVASVIPEPHVQAIDSLVSLITNDVQAVVNGTQTAALIAPVVTASAPPATPLNPFSPSTAPIPNEPGTTGKTIAENLADGNALELKVMASITKCQADLTARNNALSALDALAAIGPDVSGTTQAAIAAQDEAKLTDTANLAALNAFLLTVKNWLVNVQEGQPVGAGTTAGPLPVLPDALSAL